MNIGLDVSGGDFAPRVNLLGAVQANQALNGSSRIFLFGNETEILNGLFSLNEDPSNFEIIHSSEIIGMEDHPTRAFARKRNASIAIGFDYLSEGKIDVFASTGNTGAMLVGAIYKINTIPGVIRPCITATIPCVNGKKSVLLDVGSNADCKVDVLYQFAELGSLYAENILKIEKPRIGLLNIGEEESKGNLLIQAVFKMLQDSDSINFIGNVEGRDIFTNKADVIVCDGFTGNIVLKEAEGFYNLLKARGIEDDYFNLFNFENYGGTPILGVKGNVVIGHGSSNETAVLNMILHAHQVAENKLSVRITKAFK
ncbi:MAG: hypothetical protein RL365_1178 [Bacteroidota bacterium]|jgi:glycerol-3-phosphate acyltransferase PlsX